jgi:hypothetical protein
MKAIICFLLPVLLFAQNPFPDTLLLTDGRTYPCLITGISDSKIEMIYANNKSESVILKAVDQITIEGHGAVYKAGRGYTTDLHQIEDFIEDRNREREEELIVKEELARLSVSGNNDQTETTTNSLIVKKALENRNWSFGVLYVPYYSGIKYGIDYNYDPYSRPATYSFTDFETNLEGQLSYGNVSDLRVTLDAAYSSSFAERRYERHVTGNYVYDYGTLKTLGLKLIDFTIGVKYYFKDVITEMVSIYALAGFGKQFAFAKSNYEELFLPEPGYTVQDNAAEYLEDLNSPWHFNLGFGAEYFFNESLSLTSNIRILYSAVSGKYDYKLISEFETQTRSEEYSSSDIITRFGLGLNFYF